MLLAGFPEAQQKALTEALGARFEMRSCKLPEEVTHRLARGDVHEVEQRRLSVTDDSDRSARLPALGEQRRSDGLRRLLSPPAAPAQRASAADGRSRTLPTVTSRWRLKRPGTALGRLRQA